MLTFPALSLMRITTALFVYSEVVSRQNKSMKIDFLLILMFYHRKISAFIKNKMLCKLGIYQRLHLAKKSIKNVISNFVLIVEAKPVKSGITENIANFQIKLICRLIYGNKFYQVWKFHVHTTELRNFIKV